MSELIISRMWRKIVATSLAVITSVLFTGCGELNTGQATPPAAPSGAGTAAGAAAERAGVLQVGDLVKIDFSGPTNAPQPHEEHIKDDGTISLQYVESVKASGKSAGQLQKEIHDLYVPRYYKYLNVTVRAADQLYYVGGEVRQGGRQPYLGPVTVLGAIKAAGDFTEFANRKKVKVLRADGTIHKIDCVKALENPELDLPVYPGDRIDVPSRIF